MGCSAIGAYNASRARLSGVTVFGLLWDRDRKASGAGAPGPHTTSGSARFLHRARGGVGVREEGASRGQRDSAGYSGRPQKRNAAASIATFSARHTGAIIQEQINYMLPSERAHTYIYIYVSLPIYSVCMYIYVYG